MHSERVGAPILVLILIVYTRAGFWGVFGLGELLPNVFSGIGVTPVTSVLGLGSIPNGGW